MKLPLNDMKVSYYSNTKHKLQDKKEKKKFKFLK